MPAVIVLGSQWGDEGKGKVVDVFSEKADFVVRYQGGANAGHTLKVGGEEIVLHLVPSGILRPSVRCVISTGVALDIEALCDEVLALKKSGFLKSEKQLSISDSATLVLESHKRLDQARESKAKQEKIGTTGKGIGPAYESRASRKALIFSDLFQPENALYKKLQATLLEHNFLLEQFYKTSPVNAEDLLPRILKWGEILRPFRCSDSSFMIYEALQKQKRVLFEGAQGSLLDVFHGTYPYVTGSSTLAGGALTGVGIGPQSINKVLAITKAYTTRVGSGPFPTECSDTESGELLQKKGKEFGATTGRRRRCGWLDLPALKYAIRINGITNLALMKLDVLSALKEIKVCVGYSLHGKKISRFPGFYEDLEKVVPEYKTFLGWEVDLNGVKSKKDLPKEARDYIDFISDELQTSIDVISIGPGRLQTIWTQALFPPLQESNGIKK